MDYTPPAFCVKMRPLPYASVEQAGSYWPFIYKNKLFKLRPTSLFFVCLATVFILHSTIKNY
uniref:Uncharacterized protein n=1 Tax=Lepeophtheirus salmonis TaxID=72036 RepID=A0A0K2UZX3_LEPSM